MHSAYLDAIRTFEGFTAKGTWDYAQVSNGYGTKALYPGEVIDRAEAERRFQAEIRSAREIVDRHAAHLDEGTKAALTSLTYNAGTSWVSSGLGDAVRRGDLGDVRQIFQQYNKAGGEVLPGLVSRRAAEAMWIGNPDFASGTAVAQSPVATAAVEMAPAAAQGTEARPVGSMSLAPRVAEAPVCPMRSVAEEAVFETPSSSTLSTRSEPSHASLEALLAASLGKGDAAEAASGLADLARMMRLDQGLELRRDAARSGDDRRRA